MPFTFDGKPPALLGATGSNPPATSATSADGQSLPPLDVSGPAVFGSFSNVNSLPKSAMCFGSSPSFGATSSFGAAAAFGKHGLTSSISAEKFGLESPRKSPPSPRANPQMPAKATSDHWSDELLMQSLERLTNDRPAMFEVPSIAADKYLQRMVANFDDPAEELKSLHHDLRIAEKEAPRVADFLYMLFASKVGAKRVAPAPLSGSDDHLKDEQTDLTTPRSPDAASQEGPVEHQCPSSVNIFSFAPRSPQRAVLDRERFLAPTGSKEDHSNRKSWFCETCPLPSDSQSTILPRADSTQPFRFMSLPPEIRLWVYNYLLAPTGEVRLLSCKHRAPIGTSPFLWPAILRVSKLTAHEAKGIIHSNQFIVTVSAERTARLPLHRMHTPPHLLRNITKMTIILDVADRLGGFGNISALQHTTSLCSLNICALAYDSQLDPENPRWQACLSEILERIPATCTVHYGSPPGEDSPEFAQLDQRVDEILSHANSLKDKGTGRTWAEHVAKGKLGEVRPTILEEAVGFIEWGDKAKGHLNGSDEKMGSKAELGFRW